MRLYRENRAKEVPGVCQNHGAGEETRPTAGEDDPEGGKRVQAKSQLQTANKLHIFS